MKTILSVLFTVSAISAVQVDYIAPVASGYIYRSDNNGPASLIQLGAVPYQPSQAFAPSLKLDAVEAYDLEPLPLPYVAAKQIALAEAASDDDHSDNDDESSDEYLDADDSNEDDHVYEKGAGSDYGEEQHHAYGEKGSKGYNSQKHHQDGEKGHYGKEHHEGHYAEAEGKKEKHHDEADAHGKHNQEAESYEGGDHGHKKYSSKGEDITGYHKVFHKDEFKKDHKFYDVADNSGHFKKHGFENDHHGSEKGEHEKAGHHDSSSSEGDFGKAGFLAKGQNSEEADSHSSEEGNDSHYKHNEDFGKKGGSGYEKEYEYDDGDYDDEE